MPVEQVLALRVFLITFSLILCAMVAAVWWAVIRDIRPFGLNPVSVFGVSAASLMTLLVGAFIYLVAVAA